MPGYPLCYVALAARDVDSVCRFLGDSLRLHRTDLELAGAPIPFYGVGQAAVAVFAYDDPYLDDSHAPGVHHMALAAADPAASAAVHGLAVTAQGNGPAQRCYVALDRAATCGIRTRFVEPLQVPAAITSVDRIDHLGIASTDNDACINVFTHNLGCPLESTQTDIEIRNITESFVSDKYGAVYHSRPPEILGGLRAAFVTVGDCELEIMMDYDSDLKPKERLGEHAGNTKGDQSAIANFLSRRGAGLAHVAFQTQDIDALLDRLGAEGWRMIDQQGRPGGRGSRIGFVHPSNFGGGLLIHFVEPRKA